MSKNKIMETTFENKKKTAIERSHYEFSLLKKEQSDMEYHLQYIGKFKNLKNKSDLHMVDDKSDITKKSKLDLDFKFQKEI